MINFNYLGNATHFPRVEGEEERKGVIV